jgi:hypothetical protein
MKRVLHETLLGLADLSLPLKLVLAGLTAFCFTAVQYSLQPPSRAPLTESVADPFLPKPAASRAKAALSPEGQTPKESSRAAGIAASQPHPFTVTDPEVGPDGSIKYGDRYFYLAEIKRFNSKQVCTRASGEPWACGLHAYATLRNTVANKTISCEPKELSATEMTASCKLGATNVVLFLLRTGVAELKSGVTDPELAAAQEQAKLAKLGVWDR